MPDDDDARWSLWMARAQEGDESAYQSLLEEVAGVIAAYLKSRFGNEDFVEDCVQECLISLHRARRTYDPSRPFRAWLFAIVRNQAIDTLRRRDAFTRTNVAMMDPALAVAEGTAFDPAELAGGEVLRALSEPDREALTLTKIVGFSMAEAASRIGISESAMKTRVHRAMRRVKRLIDADDVDGRMTDEIT